MRKWLRENGLSIAMFVLFAISLIGQVFAGHRVYNTDQEEHGQQTVQLSEYLSSGHFVESVFENWESEFLQMAAFVLLTAYLYQKGSAESKRIGVVEEVDLDPRDFAHLPDAPGPVKRGGLSLKLYEHSLGLTFTLLFLASVVIHA